MQHIHDGYSKVASMVAIEGGCMCGAVRYELRGALSGATICHCRACQYVSGGGPAYTLTLPKANMSITRGQARSFWSVAEDGARVARHFCTACGTPLFGESAKDSAQISVKVGSLDDPSLFTPIEQIWVSEAQPWSPLDNNLPQAAKGPAPALQKGKSSARAFSRSE